MSSHCRPRSFARHIAAGPFACHEATLIVAPLTNPTPTSAMPLRPCARAQALDAQPLREGAWESRKDFALISILRIVAGH
eukprot:1612906-Alexandrium_andersonii.AAC.1